MTRRKLGEGERLVLIYRYFYSLMYVGTPPQRQTVILDTGSSILAFPCDSFVLSSVSNFQLYNVWNASKPSVLPLPFEDD